MRIDRNIPDLKTTRKPEKKDFIKFEVYLFNLLIYFFKNLPFIISRNKILSVFIAIPVLFFLYVLFIFVLLYDSPFLVRTYYSKPVIAEEVNGYFYSKTRYGFHGDGDFSYYFKPDWDKELELIEHSYRNFESCITGLKWKTKGEYNYKFTGTYWNKKERQLEFSIRNREPYKKEFYAIKFKEKKPFVIVKIPMPEWHIRNKEW